MNNEKILTEPIIFASSIILKNLIFMLHGYGDTADNFIHIAGSFRKGRLKSKLLLL